MERDVKIIIKKDEKIEEFKPILGTIEDISQIKALSYSFWGREGIYSEEFYEEVLKENLSYAYKDQKILIAICLVRLDQDYNNFISIDLLCVNPNYQRKGFGKALLSFCINNCVEKGYNKFYLHVSTTNKKALNLYYSLGFFKAKFIKDYYINDEPPDKDAYMMKLYKYNKFKEFHPKLIKPEEKEKEREKFMNRRENRQTSYNYDLNNKEYNKKFNSDNNNFNHNTNYNNFYRTNYNKYYINQIS